MRERVVTPVCDDVVVVFDNNDDDNCCCRSVVEFVVLSMVGINNAVSSLLCFITCTTSAVITVFVASVIQNQSLICYLLLG